MSSRLHVAWALAVGGRLGYGNDPRYNKTRCFEPFPFPDPDEETKQRIRDLGEKLDAHRKRQQESHPDLTLTGIYNVLERLRELERHGGVHREEPPEPGPRGSVAFSRSDPNSASGPGMYALNEQEREIHDKGLVSVLKQIHDDLDEAVFHAYGWDDLHRRFREGEDPEAAENELLERLVALNHERAEEEKRGLVRWLRPEFQAPEEDGVPREKQREIEFEAEKAAAKPALKAEKRKWPSALPEQVAAVQKLLPATGPDAEALSALFGRKSKKRIAQIEGILETLQGLGHL